MEAVFKFLAANPYMLLFFAVGLAVWIGRFNIKGYGLGMVAAAIVVGCGLSVWASAYGVKLELNNFAKSLFYYLFMYGVGLRVGPSFINSLGGDGLKFTILAVVSSVVGLTLVVVGAKMFDLPRALPAECSPAAMTMSAAIGSAEQAIPVMTLPPGTTPEGVSAMIALSYGITYIWGTVGIILICKYLPRWWGIDAKAAAKKYEDEFGVANVEGTGMSGFRPVGLRAYRLENAATAGKSIEAFRKTNPEYRVINVVRNNESLGADPTLVMQRGDVVALGGAIEASDRQDGLDWPRSPRSEGAQHSARPGGNSGHQQRRRRPRTSIVPGFPDRRSGATGQARAGRRAVPGGPQDQAAAHGHPHGRRSESAAVNEAGDIFGRIARPSTSTDLLTLAVGMILGFLIGLIQFPLFGSKVGLGNAGGLLLSGVIVSSLVSRLRFFGNTPNAARNVLEDLGLVVFVAIVGINAGNSLLAQLTGAIALKIFIVGFIACSIPPFIVWAIGYHFFKINPAVLMGGVAGARSHSGPCREAAVEINSTVPWIGFPVGYAVSGVLLTVFGYLAMMLAQ